MKTLILAIVLVGIAQAVSAPVTTAQKLNVKIVDRQDSATGYTYTAPAYFNSQSNSNVNCYGDVTCNESTTTTGSISPPRRISYQVRGETYKVLAILEKPNDEAYRDLKANGPHKFEQPAPTSVAPQDVFVWFDESPPGPGVPLFEAVVTARAYDGALAIL